VIEKALTDSQCTFTLWYTARIKRLWSNEMVTRLSWLPRFTYRMNSPHFGVWFLWPDGMVASSITPEYRPLLGQCISWSSLDASRLREPISYFGVEPREMIELCLVVILLRPLHPGPWCLRVCQRWGHQTAILRIIPEITPYTADLPPGLDIPPSSNFSQALSKRLDYASGWVVLMQKYSIPFF